MAKRSRGLSSRKPADYDNEVHGRSDTNAPPDDRCINTGLVPVNVFRPKYKEGPMIYRPFPMLDYAKPSEMLQPSRKSRDHGGQSHWIVRVAAAAYVGSVEKKQVTFLLNMPGDKEGSANNPYRALYYAAKQAHDSGRFATNTKWDSDWNRLLVGKPGQGAPLDKPTHKYFTQGAMLQNGEKIFLGDRRLLPLGLQKGDDLCVQELPSSAGRGLFSLLDLEWEEFEGDEDEDPSIRYQYGNPTGYYMPKKGIIEDGNFIMVFNPGVTKVGGVTGRNCTERKDDDMGKGYDVKLLSKVELNKTMYLPGIDAAGTEQVFEKVCFWFDDPDSSDGKGKGLLNIAPIEQQCAWIAQAFANVPKLIQHAWADREDYFTDEVNGILRARVQGSVPGRDDDDDRRDDRRRDDRDDRRSSRDDRYRDDDPPRSRRDDRDDDRRRDDRDDDRRRDDRDDDRRRDDRDDRRRDDEPRGRRDDDRRRDDEDDDAPPRRRSREDDDAPPRGSARRDPTQGADRDAGDDDDDPPGPRGRRAPADDDAPPPRRSGRAAPADDDPPARRGRPAPADDEGDDPPVARRGDDDDDAPPRRRGEREPDRQDDPPARSGRRAPADEDAPPARGGRRAPADDDDAPPPRRSGGRAAADDDDPPRRRGGRDDESEDAAGRGRGRAADDDAPPPRRGGRAAPADDDAPPPRRGGRAAPADDDAPPPRRGGRAAPADDDAPPPRRGGRAAPADDDGDDPDYFAGADDAPAGGKDEFADDPPPRRGGNKDADLDRSRGAAESARSNGGRRNAAPADEAPAPKDKKPAGRSRK